VGGIYAAVRQSRKRQAAREQEKMMAAAEKHAAP